MSTLSKKQKTAKIQATRDAASERLRVGLPEDIALPRPYFRSTGLRERKFWRLTPLHGLQVQVR